MANLTLELNINSASNLANVNLFTKMEVYGVITIHGDNTQTKQKVKTAVDHSGGSHPTWNHAVKFSVNERLARDGRSALGMRLISRRRVLGNKDIGGVNVPLLELLNSIPPSFNGNGNGQEMKFVTYQVKSPSGKRKGSLTFSYRFKPDIPAILNRSSVNTAGFSSAAPTSEIEHSHSAPQESSTARRKLSKTPFKTDSDRQKYPVAAGSSVDPLPVSYGPGLSPYDKTGYAYHHASAPQSSYAYFVPPKSRHQGYGPYGYAPASPAGYGYGCPSTQQPKGIGLGLGLAAGILGGLMVGDIVSDVANCFDI